MSGGGPGSGDGLHRDAVLVREPRARVTPLADGRLLLRHPRGITVLGGVAPSHLDRLLDLLDGRRTVGAVVEALAQEFEAAGVLAVMRVLARCGVLRPLDAEARNATAAAGAAVAVRGGGAGELAAALRAAGLTTVTETVARLDDAAAEATAGAVPTPAVRVAVAGGASWGELLRLQRRSLDEGVALLPVVLEPDGVRLGPWLVPSLEALAASPPGGDGPSPVGPCLGCAAVHRFAALRLTPVALLDALGDAPTLAPAELAGTALWNATVGLVGRAVTAALALPSGSPGDDDGAETTDLAERLVRGTVHLPADGGEARRRTLTRHPGCQLCAGARPPTTAPSLVSAALAQRAEESAVAAGEAPARRVRVGAEDGPPPSVIVLGGGSAGYLAALALRSRHPRTRVRLIESPDVPVIGVGEATTPLTPQFLHADLGLDVGDLFRRVEPTLKLGIRFDWGRPAPYVFHYPFGPLRLADAAAHDGGVATASLRSLLMAAGRVPMFDGHAAGAQTHAAPRPRFATAVAYHLDNRRFVAWLQRQAERAGVERLSATVAEVQLGTDGTTVAELVADDGRRFAADLYLDCSGFRSLLVGDALGSPFVPFTRSLFTDRAAVATHPLDGPPPPYTRAETWDAGWCWSTPQRREDHRGYVYASAFLSDDEAVAELRRRLPAAGEPRVLRFASGRRAHFLRGNVAALGNAYGFVEPLESTALHLLIRQIGLLLGAYPWRAEERGRAALLDRTVAGWWDYLAWFLALHYRFNGRLDTPFWRACRADVDVSAWGELLDLYRQGGPLSADPALGAVFDAPDPLWGAEGIDLLLLAQGVEGRAPQPLRSAAEHRAWLAAARRLTARALPHADALAAFDADPALLDALAAPFRVAGPAFP